MADMNDWDSALDEMKKVEEKLMASAEAAEKKKVNSERSTMVTVIATVVVAIAAIAAFLLLGDTPAITTTEIPGDPTQFDPPSSLQEVQEFAGDDVRFLALTMDQIRLDGTINLKAGTNSNAEYVFVHGSNNGNDDNAGYEYVIVTVTDLNMSRRVSAVPAEDVIPEHVVPPNCSIEELWLLAKTYNAPSTGTAYVQYNVDGYHFVIDEFDVDLQFNEDCILLRS